MRKTNKQQTGQKLAPKSKKIKKARNIRRFATIVGVIVGSFLLVSSVLAFFYVQDTVAEVPERPSSTPLQANRAEAISTAQQEESGPGWIANMLLPPERTNFMITGVDAGSFLTDVVLVGSFNRETQEITIISIPRDTRITLPKEDIKELNELGRSVPGHGTMRINTINVYGGKDHGITFLRRHIERMLDIEIDYYALVDLRAFRNIVDAVGGVYMDIPSGGLFYDDPYQNLKIRVPGGPNQLLDGAKAEGVVRFRATYRGGDLQRINVQQEFMKQFFAQAINKDNIIQNLGQFLMTIINYVRTDFGLTDIPLYLRYAAGLDPEKITFLTLPGHAPVAGEGEASYFYHDLELTTQMVHDVFYSDSAAADVDDTDDDLDELLNNRPDEAPDAGLDAPNAPSENTVASTNGTSLEGLRVQILNGGVSDASFERHVQNLEAAGAIVVEKGSFTGSKNTGTRILVHKIDTSELLSSYFSDTSSEINVGLSQRFDAVIIVGNPEI
jgi:LCP family protein required for cell wall assembly